MQKDDWKIIFKKRRWTIPSNFSMSPILSFKDIKKKDDVYRGKDFQMLKKKHEKKITLKREKLIN